MAKTKSSPTAGLRSAVRAATKTAGNAKLLKDFLSDHKMTAVDLAKKLSWAPSYVSMLRNGRIKPSLERATELERFTQKAGGPTVAANAWM